jgi:hypothetical protein
MMRFAAVAMSAFAVGSIAAAPAAAQKGDRTRLMPEEMATKPEITNVYDAIKAFRPTFLRARTRGAGADDRGSSGYAGGSGKPEPALYIDETRFDRLEDLRNLKVSEVTEIRLLSESETSVRFGPGHPFGALMVTTNRRTG